MLVFNPRDFRVDDPARIVEAIRRYRLGTVFSVSGSGEYWASSIPFLVNDACTELTGHIARANKQWEELEGKNVLVVFNGPGHYISPEWYGEEYAVPTWNYVTVQVRGIFRTIEGEYMAMRVLDDLSGEVGSAYGSAWKADWTMSEYRSMLGGIIPFRIEIVECEGKWKLSQNHPAEAVDRVASELRRHSDRDAVNIAGLMEDAAKRK